MLSNLLQQEANWIVLYLHQFKYKQKLQYSYKKYKIVDGTYNMIKIDVTIVLKKVYIISLKIV